MASIIKNQILKHLSKFTKNLSPDQINLSTLKGEGELSNLELDEAILMDLLDLPTWMRLTKAICTRVSIKISWTKLKSQPICLYLDEVVLEIETCEDLRPPNNPAHMASYRSGGKYGFVDRVIDGIYVHINAVSVKFISKKFSASLQLSRVKVHSVLPTWGTTSDLRQTRIRDESRDELLLFKEVDWQTTRVEATTTEDEVTTPLRLIANQSKIRIAIKKRLSDCSIISSRVILLLDDLLWVLTDTQLKSAIVYANSLKDIIEKSAQQSKKLAAEKLQKQGHLSSGGQADQILLQQQQQQRARSQSGANLSRLFAKYDVVTTSYHVITSRIDLHLCDDSTPEKESSPKHNRQIDGGAMQVTFCKLSVDVYPFHPAGVDYPYKEASKAPGGVFAMDENKTWKIVGGERKQWYRYTETEGSRHVWVQDLFDAFRRDVTKARQTCSVASPSQSPAHIPAKQKSPSRAPPSPQTGARGQSPRPRVTKLLESCTVMKIEEFIIYRISTADNQRSAPQKFLCSDKKVLHLPSDMPVVHMEYTDYYFTEGIDYPVPHANLYVLVNPVRLTVDYLTMLWANYFSLNIAQMIEMQESMDTKEHVDIKIEALMPRVIVPADKKVEDQPERPESLQIQISKLTATNTQVEDGSKLTDLQSILDQYEGHTLFTSRDFPNDRNDLTAIPGFFKEFAHSSVNPYIHKYAKDLISGELPPTLEAEEVATETIAKLLKTGTLKMDASYDLWSVKLDQVWLEFLGVPLSRTRPVPFVESVPLSLWICQPQLVNKCSQTAKSSPKETLPNGDITRVAEKDKLTLNLNNLGRTKDRPIKQKLREYYSPDKEDSKTVINESLNSKQDPGALADSSGSGSVDCDTFNSQTGVQGETGSQHEIRGGNVQSKEMELADVHIVGRIGGKVRAQLNHYQYLFLMRMIEAFSDFQANLNADFERFSPNSGGGSTFSLPLCVPDLEFAMVCPYVRELLPLTEHSDICSPITDGSSVSRDDYENEMEVRGQEGDAGIEMDEKEGSSDDQVVTVTESEEGVKIHLDFPEHHQAYLPKSQSDSTIMCHSTSRTANPILGLEGQDLSQTGSESGSSLSVQKPFGLNIPDSHSSNGLSSASSDAAMADFCNQSVQFIASDSGLSSLSSTLSGQEPRSRSHSRHKVNKATDQMKKSLTTAVTNFASFTGKIKNKLDPEDALSDDLETISIKTDQSDEDGFELLSLEEMEAPAFNHGMNSETASTTDTDVMDDLSSFYAESTSASKAKELVSVVVFRLSESELLIQSRGEDTAVCIQTRAIDSEEPGNIIYEDFYSKLSAAAGYLREPCKHQARKDCPVKFKFMNGPSAGLEAPRGEELGFMRVEVDTYKFNLKLSSITSMTNFIEDEKISPPVPMHVDVKDLALTLVEDRPPLNLTSPGNVPVDLDIGKVYIRRYVDGIFHITGDLSPLALPKQESDRVMSSAEVIKPESLNYAQDAGNLSVSQTKHGTTEEKKHRPLSRLKYKTMDDKENSFVSKLRPRTTEETADLTVSQQTLETKEDLPVSYQRHLQDLEQENTQLKKLLEDLEQLRQEQEESLDRLEGVEKENESLREKLKESKTIGEEKEKLEQENKGLLERLSNVEDEMDCMKVEKESLVSTLRLLQDDLIASEQRQQRNSLNRNS